MNRAEERAIDAWAVYEYREHPKGLYHTCFVDGYKKGYEEAEKDTIERAVTWLKDNANKYIVDLTETYPDAPVNIIVGGMCWEDLTKYLKDNDQH